MNRQLLTQKECTAMRGIAIIAIVLHNYCHFIGRIVKENEYLYHTSNNDRLLQILTHPDSLLPVHLFSYFGHYGVPVFLFLSGYGLVMKYESAPICPASRFLRYNYLKLLRMLIVGFSLFICIDMVTPGHFPFHWDKVLAQLLMYINILPEPDRIIWPGIYWFFGLMMQLYIVYRLLLYRRHWGWTLALMAVCTLAQLLMGPESEELNRYRYNFMGGMLPFGLGLLYARMPMQLPRSYNWLFLIISLMLIYSSGQTYFGWMFVPVFVCSAAFTVVKILPGWLLQSCQWLGGISAALFVCHPVIRKIIIPISRHGDVYTGLLLYIVAAIVVAVVWSRTEGKK